MFASHNRTLSIQQDTPGREGGATSAREMTLPFELFGACDASIEVDEYDRLLVKERAAQELLGDDVQEPVTRESMLNEFLTSIKELREDRADS
jgi:hypothetical protein